MKGKVYYKTECGKIIVHYRDKDIYVHKNDIKKDDKSISKEYFETLKSTKIKKNDYNRMMNEWFKDIHDEWTYKGHDYVSKDNFKTDGKSLSTNYVIGRDVPFHDINEPGEDYYYLKHLILVYRQGKVYYHTISYGGYKTGQLVDVNTHKLVGWCQLKHCAPVFDKTIKKII